MTLDTVADESRKKMSDGVARSPCRLCSRDGKICCYGDALSTIFLLACFCALLPTFRFSFIFSFLFFLSLHHGMFISFCPFVCAAAICYSQQVPGTYFIVRVISACCVICTLPHHGIICFFYSFSIFFVALIYRVVFFLLCSRTRYAST